MGIGKADADVMTTLNNWISDFNRFKEVCYVVFKLQNLLPWIQLFIQRGYIQVKYELWFWRYRDIL